MEEDNTEPKSEVIVEEQHEQVEIIQEAQEDTPIETQVEEGGEQPAASSDEQTATNIEENITNESLEVVTKPEPVSPQKVENVTIVKQKEVSEGDKIRTKLLHLYEEALQRNQILSQNNSKKQKAIMDYLRNSKKVGVSDTIMDATSRYVDLLLVHKDTRLRLEKLREKNDKLLDSTKQLLIDKRLQLDMQNKLLYDTVIQALPESEKSKAVQKEIIEEWIPKFIEMDREIVKRRMEYLQSKSVKESLEQSIKEKEEFSKGLHLIDFEQLKMENASYSEKIEEKNEAIHKTKTKSTSMIHILAHVKEKLLFVQMEKISLQKKLDELELHLNHHKSLLNQLKKDREELKHSNEVIKDDNPLIGSDTLLLDYGNRKKEYIFYKAQLMEYQDKYHMLKEKNDLYLHTIQKHEGLIKVIVNNGGMRAFDPYNQEKITLQKQEVYNKEPVAPINLSLLNYERMLDPSYRMSSEKER